MKAVSVLAIGTILWAVALCGTPRPVVQESLQGVQTTSGPQATWRLAILSLLSDLRRPALLEVHGQCIGTRTIASHLNVFQPKVSNDARASLEHALDSNQSVHVEQGPNRIIRIYDDRVSRSLQAVHIKRLEFSDEERFNPIDALLEALNSPEVRQYMQRNRIGFAPELNGLRVAPSPELPHLEPVLSDTTVSQLEVDILTRFPGMITYQECQSADGNKLISVGFENLHLHGPSH